MENFPGGAKFSTRGVLLNHRPSQFQTTCRGMTIAWNVQVEVEHE
jgi:hypothetical protein